METCCLMGARFYLGKMKCVLVIVTQKCECIKCHRTVCFKMVKMAGFVLCVFYYNKNYIYQKKVCVCSVAQSCLPLCTPKDCNLPGSSTNGIFQASGMRCHFLV